MTKDKRDLLEVLKAELQFLEKGATAPHGACAVAPAVYISGFADLSELRSHPAAKTVQ